MRDGRVGGLRAGLDGCDGATRDVRDPARRAARGAQQTESTAQHTRHSTHSDFGLVDAEAAYAEAAEARLLRLAAKLERGAIEDGIVCLEIPAMDDDWGARERLRSAHALGRQRRRIGGSQRTRPRRKRGQQKYVEIKAMTWRKASPPRARARLAQCARVFFSFSPAARARVGGRQRGGARARPPPVASRACPCPCLCCAGLCLHRYSRLSLLRSLRNLERTTIAPPSPGRRCGRERSAWGP